MASTMSYKISYNDLVTPEEFLAIDPEFIEYAHFIPPKLGDRDFGKFFVRYLPGSLSALNELESKRNGKSRSNPTVGF